MRFKTFEILRCILFVSSFFYLFCVFLYIIYDNWRGGFIVFTVLTIFHFILRALHGAYRKIGNYIVVIFLFVIFIIFVVTNRFLVIWSVGVGMGVFLLWRLLLRAFPGENFYPSY